MTIPTTYQCSRNAWRNADSPSMKRRIPTVNTESQRQEIAHADTLEQMPGKWVWPYLPKVQN